MCRKINLILAFSPCNIHILCESIHDKNTSLKKQTEVQINRMKETPLVCKVLKKKDKPSVHTFHHSHDLKWTLCLCSLHVCVGVFLCFSFSVKLMIPHESLFLLFICAWTRTYCNRGKIFVTECEHVGFAQNCVCVCVCSFLCVREIQISFWSFRKPEINRSQSVFRRLDRQFCFKTSKHHLYSTFRAHKCLSDIYERRGEREGERGERGAKKKEGKKEQEGTGLFLTSVKRCGATHKRQTDGRRVMEEETSALFPSLDNRNRKREWRVEKYGEKIHCVE